MKVLVIGSGGREHAVVKKMSESVHKPTFFCAPGNGGIGSIAQCVDIKATDIDGIINFCKTMNIDFVVVTPDNPLAIGMVDRLEQEGIAAFGPKKSAAMLESSKAFAKAFMKRHNIPTAAYEVFDDYRKAEEYIKAQKPPIVIKADGLALGKGVIIAQSVDEALDAAKEMLINNAFGESGNKVVVEEFIEGPEVSILAFCDGATIVPMVSAQDHKRAYDHDLGPNTGGMGAFSPSLVYSSDIAKECTDRIFLPTINGMRDEENSFKGVLFFGLMLTAGGPKLLEYNARFGDPETQVVLPRLKTDLLDIMLACANGTLNTLNIEWSDDACACIVLASGGYPVKYDTGFIISGLNTEFEKGVFVYHAGTKRAGNDIVTAGGRVLNVCAMGRDLPVAVSKAYEAVKSVSFEDMHYRKDIGIK